MLRGSTLLYRDIIDKIVNNEKYNKKFFDEIEHRMGIPVKFIRDYLGDGQTIEFLDIMSGDILKFPTSKELRDLILGTQISIYYDSLGGEEINIGYVAKKFGQTLSNTRKFLMIFDKDYDKDKEKTFGEIEDEEEFTENEEDEEIESYEEDIDWLSDVEFEEEDSDE